MNCQPSQGMFYRDALRTAEQIVRRPFQRIALIRKLALRLGYDPEMWIRVPYNREWREFLAELPLKSLRVLEISPGGRPVVDPRDVTYHHVSTFPEFDICSDTLSQTFDIIIAEQVFEHLRHPYRAARNVHRMLSDDGVFLIATPFLIKVHKEPGDYTRWTPDGLRNFLEDCGFIAKAHSWGNRRAIKANFHFWREYGWKKDLRNEAEFPVTVWAYARKVNGSALGRLSDPSSAPAGRGDNA